MASPLWKPAEDRILIGMVAAGCTLSAVSRAVTGRSLSAVKSRYRMLRDSGKCLPINREVRNSETPDPDIEKLVQSSRREPPPEFISKCEERMRTGELILLELALLPPDSAELAEAECRPPLSPICYSASGLSDSSEFTLSF